MKVYKKDGVIMRMTEQSSRLSCVAQEIREDEQSKRLGQIKKNACSFHRRLGWHQ